MSRCPYCKIDFRVHPTMTTRKIVCRNCRNYHDAAQEQKRQDDERKLFAIFGSLPFNWQDRPQYTEVLNKVSGRQ